MQNLFSMLSQTLAHLTGSNRSGQGFSSLSLQVERLEEQSKLNANEIKKIAVLNEKVAQLQRAVSELNSISDILLSVQQQLLEDIAYSSSSKKGSSLIMMPLPGTDDDDLPN
jgi:dsDNA-specific endonuclease/ATPase MutS2